MNFLFHILLASACISTVVKYCAGAHITPECNQSTYELIMRRITEVTYHTHATVKDAYTKSKRYADNYKLLTDRKLNAMDTKLDDMLAKLTSIQTQLVALMTGPISLSPTDILDSSKTATTGIASSQIDDN